jgi:hypothetical protein
MTILVTEGWLTDGMVKASIFFKRMGVAYRCLAVGGALLSLVVEA